MVDVKHAVETGNEIVEKLVAELKSRPCQKN
jgi:hypothetical protein